MPENGLTMSKTHDNVGPAEVLGVPMLPPGGMTRLANRFRAGLARLHRGSAPPPARLLEAALGTLDVAVLDAMCRLELPKRLRTPTSCTVLADVLDLDPLRLERLLRYAATRGWVRVDRNGKYRATRTTAFLEDDHPGGWQAWVEFAAGGEVLAATSALGDGLAPDGDAFASANGAPFFTWMQAHPHRHATFDRAMAAGGRMHGLLLAKALDWSSSRRVCDIGGGDGTLLGVLLAQHPHLEGMLLELQDVVDRAPPRPRVTAIGGDAFTAVPVGCDTYLFVNVLHDWDDDAAVRLIERAAEAARSGGSGGVAPRIVIVESELHLRPRDDLATRVDLLMLALTPGGRERTTGEFAALANRAGLRLQQTHPLASGDCAHVLVPGT